MGFEHPVGVSFVVRGIHCKIPVDFFRLSCFQWPKLTGILSPFQQKTD